MPSAPDPTAPEPTAPEPLHPAGEPRVTLIGRPGCHLCEAARTVVAEVTAELGESFTELSVSDRPDLMARYADEVPVTLVDGRQHDYWRVDAARLRAALTRPRP